MCVTIEEPQCLIMDSYTIEELYIQQTLKQKTKDNK